MDNQEKKESIIWKMVKFFISLLFFGPSVKILRQNSMISYCKRINGKNTDPWFVNQKIRNWIVAIILALPLSYALYKGTTYIENDRYLAKRLEIVKHENKTKGMFDAAMNYYYVLAENPKDSTEFKNQKYETKVRIVAFLIMFSFMFSLHIAGSLISYYHPLNEDSKRLKDYLIKNGIIRKEEADSTLVFATPLGFLIDTAGNSPHEIANMDRIWAALNIKIKEWVEDPKQRSIVFFKKAYELKSLYAYDGLTKKKK